MHPEWEACVGLLQDSQKELSGTGLVPLRCRCGAGGVGRAARGNTGRAWADVTVLTESGFLLPRSGCRYSAGTLGQAMKLSIGMSGRKTVKYTQILC